MYTYKHTAYLFLAHLEQQFTNLVLPLSGSLMEGGKLPQIHHIHVAHVLHQQLCHLIVAVGTGIV